VPSHILHNITKDQNSNLVEHNVFSDNTIVLLYNIATCFGFIMKPPPGYYVKKYIAENITKKL
jgi:hypothetical protein